MPSIMTFEIPKLSDMDYQSVTDENGIDLIAFCLLVLNRLEFKLIDDPRCEKVMHTLNSLKSILGPVTKEQCSSIASSLVLLLMVSD